MTTSVLHLTPTPDLGVNLPPTPSDLGENVTPPRATKLLPEAANAAHSSTARVPIPSVTANTKIKPGLPSPASSTSETSDYQRSTPSPNVSNEDQLRSLGKQAIVFDDFTM